MIEVNDVHYTYPNGVQALKGVSLTVSNGEFIALMGQNGAGKTTLVKHFNGLLKPTKGEVLVNGLNTKNESVATLSKKVGLVFQNPDHQFFCETVDKEVSFALRNFGFEESTIKKRVDWALNLLDLSQYRDASPFMLSGGERKRVALASILAWDPQIVVLDEPTIGQDHAQKERLMEFIVQLNAQGKTAVIVTHDIEFVAECRPQIVLMADGKIVAKGEANDVLTDPELINHASLVLPEVSRIFSNLRDVDLPRNVIDIYDACEILLARFRDSK